MSSICALAFVWFLVFYARLLGGSDFFRCDCSFLRGGLKHHS